jgi:exodeoxyribonuclease VII large subunit
MASESLELGVGEFVTYVNQTLEYAYPNVVIVGELANLRISKNKWVYFDLKDEFASVRFFGTVYMLKHQLEDGMMLKVRGMPRLHPQFGFTITVQDIALLGEGTIKRSAKLLQAKLATEGLFDESRKRSIPYPPQKIGLITSSESAAYADFIKIVTERWSSLEIQLIDVHVQGIEASGQIVRAIDTFNQLPEEFDALVLIRGGGSADDLQAFSDESVVRAVATSRTPTLVAIGHEIDSSLAELAADRRASTPSNAAELLVPDRAHELLKLERYRQSISHGVQTIFTHQKEYVKNVKAQLVQNIAQKFIQENSLLNQKKELLVALSPDIALQRGYAYMRKNNEFIRSGTQIAQNDIVEITLKDALITAQIQDIRKK